MIYIDHVAIVIDSVDSAIHKLNYYDWFVDDVNYFQSEGTKEVYVGNRNQSSRLLLIEPVSDGPYMKALRNRGAGIHHIAVNVPDFNDYLLKLTNSGWYLHLHSWFSKNHNTLWLARAQTQMLIELHENLNQSNDPFIEKVYLPNILDQHLFKSLNVPQIEFISSTTPILSIADTQLNLNELLF